MRIVILILLFTGILLHALASRRWAMPVNQHLLQQRAATGLKADDRFSAVTVEFNLLDGRIAGRVPSQEAREEALATAQSFSPAGRLFDHIEVVRPRDQAAKVTVSGTGGGLSLTGIVGEESLKSDLAAALASVVSARPIKNELTVSDRVRKPEWGVSAEPLIAWFFQRVPDGSLELGEHQFVLRGRIKGEAARDALVAEARALLPSDGNLVSEIDLQPDRPAQLIAKRDGDRIVVSGRLPDLADATSVVKSLSAKNAAVQNLLEADSGVMAPRWLAALPSFLQGFFADGSGEVILDGNRLSLKGDRPASKGRAPLAILLDPMRKAGCEVTDLIRLVPDLEPVLRARLTDGVFRLEGQVATEASRDHLLEAAEASGASSVENTLEVNAAVKPETWIDSAPAILRGLFTNRQAGELAFEGTQWRIQGETANAISREAMIAEATKLLPKGTTLDTAGLRLGSAVVQPVRFVLKDGHLSGSGSVATLERKAAIERDLISLRPVTLDMSQLTVNPASAEAAWSQGIVGLSKDFFQGTSQGELELQPGSVRLKREFPSPAAKETFLASVTKALPQGTTLIDQTKVTVSVPPTSPPTPAPLKATLIAKSPSSLHAQFRPGERRLQGNLPDDASRKALTAGLKSGSGSAKLINELKVSAQNGEAAWAPAISSFLPRFGSLVRQGDVEIRDGNLTLSGETFDPATRDLLLAELSAALPNDLLNVEDKMSVLQPDSGSGTLPAFVVYFNRNSDWIRPDGREQLEKASAFIATLPAGTTVLVKGFADSGGDPVGNQILSEKRAKAVQRYLGELGIKKEQVELIGVGAQLARKGRSEEIRSKDRRVEIIAVRK